MLRALKDFLIVTPSVSPQARAKDSTSTSNLVGKEYFDLVHEMAYSTFKPGEIGDVFRASLTAGWWGAQTMLEASPKLSAWWRGGDSAKAASLVEVWASTVALSLFQNEPDQEAVCQGVARGLANYTFNSDEDLGYKELKSFRDQQQADEEIRKQGGIPTYAYTLLYLRCVRALGKDVSLAKIPIPIPSIEELLETGVLDYNPPFDEVLMMLRIHAESVVVAKQRLTR